jgi:predicted O-methyltransferase YrrM
MDDTHTKPKLVFFQYKYDQNLPEFLLTHKQDHVTCLAQFFDVTVICEDCDYEWICDKYKPDLTLFEGGVNHRTCRRPKVTNTHVYPEIPKIGLHNADAWCDARAGFLSDMEHLGIETFFAICTTAAEHLPELAENIYIWPNFIDPAIYRDYGAHKSIPVLLTGNRRSLYPWRQRVYRLVAEYYPSLVCPHRGYGAHSSVSQIMYGEEYARVINASWLVPTCGTVAKEVVRKHFEIPGCRACLIAERSAGLEAAGFEDMKNCVFADEDNILDKVDYLFQNRSELERVTEAGYRLIHSRHTLKQRDQIFQWFNLHKYLKSGQKIVQRNPFEPLTVVENSSGIRNSHVMADGLHLRLLRQGDEKLWTGKYAEAESLYLECANYLQWMPEPKLRLALCNLYQGKAREALAWITKPIEYILGEYKAIDPDPVEWAYYLACLVCLGKLDEARNLAGQFQGLHHPELDRMRWVINLLQNKGAISPFGEEKTRHRCSVHQLPRCGLNEWLERFCMMLMACRQVDLAKTVTQAIPSGSIRLPEGSSSSGEKGEILPEKEAEAPKRVSRPSTFFLGKRDPLSYFEQRSLSRDGRRKLRGRVSRLLHGLEKKWGYFLPYSLSEMRNDEFFQAIQSLAREEDIKKALIIGAAAGQGATEALLAGIKENRNEAKVFCVNGATRHFGKLEKAFAANPTIGCVRTESSSAEHFSASLVRTIKAIKRENEINFFDLVLIDTSELQYEMTCGAQLSMELNGGRLILLDDINRLYNYRQRDRLIKDSRYVLIAENAGLRNGYAIFKIDSPYLGGGDGALIDSAAKGDKVGIDSGRETSGFQTVDA